MFIPRPDASLYSSSFGRGPSTLLALGGWVGSGEVWHEVFGHLPGWRCVSFDHRGTGASAHRGPITIAAMADDILAVADAHRIDRCVLASESAGAGPALHAVLSAPHRFAGLVLVGAAWKPPAPGSQDALIGGLRTQHLATLRGFVDACLPETDSVDLRRWGVQVLARATVEHAVELLECRHQLALEDRLRQVDMPVLVVHGEHDHIVPAEHARELARGLADAELHVLPGLGHVPIVTEPALVAGLIDRRFSTPCASPR